MCRCVRLFSIVKYFKPSRTTLDAGGYASVAALRAKLTLVAGITRETNKRLPIPYLANRTQPIPFIPLVLRITVVDAYFGVTLFPLTGKQQVFACRIPTCLVFITTFTHHLLCLYVSLVSCHIGRLSWRLSRCQWRGSMLNRRLSR